MKQSVFVVTCTELGWDCVVAVYTTEEEAQKCADKYGETGIVSSVSLETEYRE